MWFGCPHLPFPCFVSRLWVWPHLAWAEIHCQPSTWVMTKFWKRFFFPNFPLHYNCHIISRRRELLPKSTKASLPYLSSTKKEATKASTRLPGDWGRMATRAPTRSLLTLKDFLFGTRLKLATKIYFFSKGMWKEDSAWRTLSWRAWLRKWGKNWLSGSAWFKLQNKEDKQRLALLDLFLVLFGPLKPFWSLFYLI